MELADKQGSHAVRDMLHRHPAGGKGACRTRRSRRPAHAPGPVDAMPNGRAAGHLPAGQGRV